MIQIANDFFNQNNIANFIDESSLATLCTVNNTASSSIMMLSIIGGFLSQEVLKAVSKAGDPMHNLFVFSSDDLIGRCSSVSSKDSIKAIISENNDKKRKLVDNESIIIEFE